MKKYTDGLAPCKLKDGAPQQVATKDDLFSVALEHLKHRSLAHTAAELLFWSQYAKADLRGRRGIYKEDKELGRVLGVHPKTAGRHVRELCAAGSKDEAGTVARPKFFEVAYGPKPKAPSGRFRWVFIRAEGRKIIAEALERGRERRERIAPVDRKKKFRPQGANQSDRSPQNAPTHISHKNASGGQSGALSSSGKAKEPATPKDKEAQAQVDRLKQSWREVCEKSNRHDLIWRDQNLDRWSKDLAEIITVLQLHELSDADLEARLGVLCNELDSISDDVSEAFAEHNRHGLEFLSFVMYAPKLMKLAAEKIPSKPAKTTQPGKVGGFKLSVGDLG